LYIDHSAERPAADYQPITTKVLGQSLWNPDSSLKNFAVPSLPVRNEPIRDARRMSIQSILDGPPKVRHRDAPKFRKPCLGEAAISNHPAERVGRAKSPQPF
jgi:hypothetical protein